MLNKDAYEQILKRLDKIDSHIEELKEDWNKGIDTIEHKLFEIDRKTLKPKLKEVVDAERRW